MGIHGGRRLRSPTEALAKKRLKPREGAVRDALVVAHPLCSVVGSWIGEGMHGVAVCIDLPVRTRIGHLLRERDHCIGRRHRIRISVQRKNARGDLLLLAELRRREQRVETRHTQYTFASIARDIECAQTSEAKADDHHLLSICPWDATRSGDDRAESLTKFGAVIREAGHQRGRLIGRLGDRMFAVDIRCESDVSQARHTRGMGVHEFVTPPPVMTHDNDGRGQGERRLARHEPFAPLFAIGVQICFGLHDGHFYRGQEVRCACGERTRSELASVRSA